MAIFSITTEHSDEVSDFIHKAKKKMESDDFLKNPFIADIIKIQQGHDNPLYVFSMSPIYFNFSIFGWFIAFAIFMIWGLNTFLIYPIILGCLGFFWSSTFFYCMAVLGLRKNGYKGKIKRLSCKQTLEKIYFGG